MNKLKAVLGYLIAALMIPVVLVTLMGMGPLAEWMVEATGVVLSPWNTGGEVVQTIDHGSYETRIHRPVFDALIGQKRQGFIQVVWAKTESLPETLTEAVDYNADGQVDFEVTLHSSAKTAEWTPSMPNALRMDGPYRIGDGLGVRVWMKR